MLRETQEIIAKLFRMQDAKKNESPKTRNRKKVFSKIKRGGKASHPLRNTRTCDSDAFRMHSYHLPQIK